MKIDIGLQYIPLSTEPNKFIWDQVKKSSAPNKVSLKNVNRSWSGYWSEPKTDEDSCTL